MSKPEALATLNRLGGRFAGIDLSARKPGSCAWPAVWRAKLVASKNERAEYRLTGYGSTAEEAIQALADQVDGVDGITAQTGMKGSA